MISEMNHRLGALRRQAQRDYWTNVAMLGVWLAIQGAVLSSLYAAWRLFCAP